ncbi:hypothetical protein D1007_56012 [Hordeum vulgare]|nr:hypothetical protein D1007_56012 [Hordeum vulgare]
MPRFGFRLPPGVEEEEEEDMAVVAATTKRRGGREELAATGADLVLAIGADPVLLRGDALLGANADRLQASTVAALRSGHHATDAVALLGDGLHTDGAVTLRGGTPLRVAVVAAPGSPYFVHMYDQGHVMKMLSDPEIVKDVHLYVSKEKAGDDVAPPSKQFDIAPSNHLNESVLLQEGGVYAEGEGAEQLTLKRPQIDKEVRKRKRTSLPIVWNMPKGQRIVVKCNENSQPIGDEGAILGKFVGTVARNGGFCPLNINDWRDVKKNSGEETILQCVQTKFVYPRSCEKWILKSIGRDWRKYKSSLKDAFFKPAIEKNPNIKRKALYKLCPEDVDIDQWRGLVKFWKSKKGRALAEKNIISRSLVKNSHNAGTKSFACWSEDMDRLKNLITERPELAQNLNGRVAWEGDALQEVLGKEKIGQVHGMGLLPTPKQVYGWTPRYLKNINMTTTDGSPYEVEHDVWEEIAKMKEHIKRQYQIIEHMKNKEGHVNNEAEEVKDFFIPPFVCISVNSLLRFAGSKVVLKTSTYPNKRNVAYGTIHSTDPRTTVCGIELGAEFALVRIDQPLLDNEELVREVSDCKTIGEAYSSGYLIAWPSAFIREKDN